LDVQVFIVNYDLFIGNKDIEPDVVKPHVSELSPCVPVVSTPKLPTSTGTPIVIHSDGELMGNDGIPSIKLNGITIYQSCVDGLLPQTMINDNIVSILME
jgi:hypothetical protein